MRKRDLQDLVQSSCVENDVDTRWVDSRPGKDWVRNFRQRWRHRVKVRKPTNIKRSRAKVSPATMRAFFERIRPNLEGISGHNIYNYDETCFKDDPGAEDAFFGGDCKYYEKIQNHSKTAISGMFCISAQGASLPPMILYKSTTGSVYASWCEGGPDGATYAANKSGWFDMDKFTLWFKEVFLPYIRRLPKEEVKVLLGDNLAAHLSPAVIELCQAHNIRFDSLATVPYCTGTYNLKIVSQLFRDCDPKNFPRKFNGQLHCRFIFLPENSTHLLQPLDVAVFGPMKRRWREVLTAWKEQCARDGTNYATIPKQVR
jgi:hypothetical protein